MVIIIASAAKKGYNSLKIISGWQAMFEKAQTMEPDTRQSTISGVLPNLLAFVFGLGLAYFQRWEVTDLVWSLWLGSLVIGYLTIFSALGAVAYLGLHAVKQKEFDQTKRIPIIVAGAGIGFFILGFFSFHFGGFHAGHSVFLQSFFPIAGIPGDGFGSAFANPPLLWALTFRHLLKPYGLFLLPALVVERQMVFRPVADALKTLHSNGSPANFNLAGSLIGESPLRSAMFRPYLNVVRMHLLIFFFAFSAILNINSFAVYAVVYFVYFFPWAELKKARHRNIPTQ
jgi:hypothetical protein